MVFIKTRMFCFISLIGMSLHGTKEQLNEEKKAAKKSISTLRQNAIEELEALAHELTQEIKKVSDALDSVMWATRDILEGNNNKPAMQKLKSDRSTFIEEIKKHRTQTQNRLEQLCNAHKKLTP